MPPQEEQWRPIEPPSALNGNLVQVLRSVDALRSAWQESIGARTAADFHAARWRSLRRHAIETGIIERLYDVDWGVTQALVAEGLTAEVAQSAGGMSESALIIIQSQFDALNEIAEFAQGERPLTVALLRDMHSALCRTQKNYAAQDQFGRVVELPLRHGAWKAAPNRAVSSSGSTIDFAPPYEVQPELDSMLRQLGEARDIHPIILAAWLHYSFVIIHPFDDGNGRVARALVLLLLLRHNYAPFVIDRHRRAEYLAALAEANGGDLRALVLLFATVQIIALRAELEPIAEGRSTLAAPELASARVAHILGQRTAQGPHRSGQVIAYANDLLDRVADYLLGVQEALARAFGPLGEVIAQFDREPMAGPRAHYWRAEVISAARAAEFYVNRSSGVAWARMRLQIDEGRFNYVAVVQKVGYGESGVLAVTV
ncbi:MAG: Fic family protein, partial [Angustibacter sp.]